jgi:hypothetical protein
MRTRPVTWATSANKGGYQVDIQSQHCLPASLSGGAADHLTGRGRCLRPEPGSLSRCNRPLPDTSSYGGMSLH